jgi:hypothetical protein
MSSGSALYLKCQQLFAGYPLAVGAATPGGIIRSIVLMLREDSNASFFVLLRDGRAERPFYSLRRWLARDAVKIEADGDIAVPYVFVNALTSGVPIPRHGSLFGWRYGKVVTALIAIYAKYTETTPEPVWSTMPQVGIPSPQWPPFICEHLFGPWFWDHYRAGRVASLDSLIARTPDTVFWANTEAVLGSGCCVVARDIKDPDGYMLPRGRYVHHQVLQAGKPVPSLQVLLADAGKTDLASRFSCHPVNGQFPVPAGSQLIVPTPWADHFLLML